MINKNIKSYKNKIIEEDIKKKVEKIFKTASSFLPIKNIIIEKNNDNKGVYNYFAFIYLIQEADKKKIKKLEKILDQMFKKENVGFLIYDSGGMWSAGM